MCVYICISMYVYVYIYIIYVWRCKSCCQVYIGLLYGKIQNLCSMACSDQIMNILCTTLMVGFHVQLNEHELEQIPGRYGGQRSLARLQSMKLRSRTRFCSLATEQQRLCFNIRKIFSASQFDIDMILWSWQQCLSY